ncbi:PepSY-associated TM helix domain-containing protein [Dyadobacter sp.]|uniref:PepSY-associated TM helix domain-containing protein n=1 Tax=Dyadobacter sp. TaxID=1914288 RepID=UPI003F72CB40
MKLQGLSNRLYNIFFHTHTVSGIVLSFGLYVIFFAGAFSLFKSEFYQWENPVARQKLTEPIDYNQVLSALKKNKPRFDLTEDIIVRIPSEKEPHITIYGHLTVPNGKPEEHYSTAYSPQTKTFSEEGTSTTGETLYRLHFFDQVPFYIGRYISGFVALFFLFATITGVLVHWRNIFSKFYGFSVKGTWKQIWTNAHTVFGMIGLPFQLMYAVTGAFYMLSILILLPVVMVFYGGDQKKVFEMIRTSEGIAINANAPARTFTPGISAILQDIQQKHPELHFKFLQLKNYDREDALLTLSMSNDRSFTSDGYISVRLKTGQTELDLLPGKKNYTQSVLFGIAKLHFATFGGFLLKSIYFLLALFTCFVIISGILLWKEARNKKNYTTEQKRFHHRVTMVYLAICFSLFPAVAVLFNSELLIPALKNHVLLVNTTFFVSWLVLAVISLLFKTEARLTWFNLLAGGAFSILIPFVNGVVTGDWFWKMLDEGNLYVAFTDLFWLVTGITSLALARMMHKRPARIPAQAEYQEGFTKKKALQW